MSKGLKPNVISQSGFAKMKNVDRNNVQTWVKSGRIELVKVGDKKMIDLDIYGDFDPSEIPKGPPVTIEGLQREVKTLKKEVATIKESLLSK